MVPLSIGGLIGTIEAFILAYMEAFNLGIMVTLAGIMGGRIIIGAWDGADDIAALAAGVG